MGLIGLLTQNLTYALAFGLAAEAAQKAVGGYRLKFRDF